MPDIYNELQQDRLSHQEDGFDAAAVLPLVRVDFKELAAPGFDGRSVEEFVRTESKLSGGAVVIIGEHDYRVPACIDLEVATMVQLGDPEAEARRSFENTKGAKFVLIYDDDAEQNSDNILGLVRFTPFSAASEQRSLKDLSLITGEAVEKITDHFMAESGCKDMSKVIDVTSFAIRPEIKASVKRHFAVANNLQYAITEYVLGSYLRGEATHCISFIETNAYQWLKGWGHPFQDFNGYTPMVYDTEKSGAGIVAQPAWLSLEDLHELVTAKTHRQLARVVANALIEVPLIGPEKAYRQSA